MLAAQTLRARDQSNFDRGDVSFIILAGALVFLMVPGLAFLYSGLARRKSALALIWSVAASNAVVIFQWYFWGYSLAFSPTASNGFIGDLTRFGLQRALDDASPGSPLIPELLYAFFQMEFACVTVGILVGGVAERGRVIPAMVFSFFWMTLVYCPLACWAWNTSGWAFTWGVLDFAGGGPVEIGSGVGGLAYAWVLGRRRERELLNFRPHNVSLVALGTFLLWFGWLGFNGGSAFGANLRAVTAIWNSMIAAAFGGTVWCALDFRYERKWSAVGLCSGTIAGLVAATPSSGMVPTWAAVVIGTVTGAVCNYATKLKFFFRIDDALDLFAEHAIGGVIGLFCNGLFASNNVIRLDGVNTSIAGGWVDHNWKQMYMQIAYIAAACGYTFVVTALIAKAVDLVPGLHLRASEEAEGLGMDEDQIGEFATDYIEVRRDFTDWTAAPTVSAEHVPSSALTNGHGPVAAGDRHGVNDLNLSDVREKRENGDVAKEIINDS
ncbi:ammonium transporter [Vararia minispora EC-137]|uniref:Ammonium transporter n=1 Tax=Vararia minispora EC-137 TaxID=1314806 RepID=A0ACB8QUH6_9AGAM|nr:ammonium transporter [Vararia minispora EC-137]